MIDNMMGIVMRQVEEGRHAAIEAETENSIWEKPELLAIRNEDERFFGAEVDMCAVGLTGPTGLPRHRPTILGVRLRAAALK